MLTAVSKEASGVTLAAGDSGAEGAGGPEQAGQLVQPRPGDRVQAGLGVGLGAVLGAELVGVGAHEVRVPPGQQQVVVETLHWRGHNLAGCR